MTTQLSMWVVYAHPTDDPEHYVARLWHGETATEVVFVAEDVADLRSHLQSMGLHRLERLPQDQPHIMEVWL